MTTSPFHIYERKQAETADEVLLQRVDLEEEEAIHLATLMPEVEEMQRLVASMPLSNIQSQSRRAYRQLHQRCRRRTHRCRGRPKKLVGAQNLIGGHYVVN
jgi:hypothetical protein